MRRTMLFSMAIFMPLLLLSNDPENGAILFRNYCKACHNLDKNLVGPALKDVYKRRSEDWIYSFVKSSNTLIENGDSTAIALFMEFNQIPMPDQSLGNEEISDILSYIVFESEKPVAESLPIPRPEMAPKPNLKPLNFGDFRFWIVYTITVAIMIGVLYYMVELTELSKNLKE